MEFVYALWESSEQQIELSPSSFFMKTIRFPSGLILPSKLVKYIGVTKNPIDRQRTHFASKDERKNPDIVAWVAELKRKQFSLNLEIIEKLEERRDAEEQEFYWINFCISQGAALFNRIKIDPIVVAAVQADIYDAGELATLVAIQTMAKYDLLDRCNGLICGAPD